MLNKIIQAFIEKKLNLEAYLFELNNLKNTTTDDNLNNLVAQYDQSQSDELMNALLILWLIKENALDNFIKQDHIYASFIKDLMDDVGSRMVQSIKIMDDILFGQINDYFLLINSTAKTKKFILPNILVNKEVDCYNCNDEMKLSDYLVIPDNSFYIIKIKEK